MAKKFAKKIRINNDGLKKFDLFLIDIYVGRMNHDNFFKK